MAKVYVISGIVLQYDSGTGEVINSFPAVAEHPVNWSAAVSFDHATNPSKNWVFVVVAGTQAAINGIQSDSRITIAPFGPHQLDNSWISIGPTNVRNQIAAFIRSRTGVQVARDDPRTVREVVSAVGLAIDPNFDPDTLDVME